MIRTSYWDRDALLHVEKDTPSENGILFAAEYWMLRKLIEDQTQPGRLFMVDNMSKRRINVALSCTVQYDNGVAYYDPLPKDLNPVDGHFSHDNMTGVYALKVLGGFNTSILPTVRWNKQYWMHPRDIAFYSLVKNNWIGVVLLPIFILSCLIAAKRERSYTSGKMLLWLRLNVLKLNKSKYIRNFANKLLLTCTKIMSKEHESNVWIDTSAIYFKDTEHPINKLMKVVYCD